MDEQVINGAAIAAINDLQLDCEIKEVCQSSGGDEWCVQFSGKYGRFCDRFKNQFEKESSAEVVREKIKGYLIKQVNKIRTTTGRRRKPAVTDSGDKRETESSIFTAPLKIVEELFDRAVGIAGGVASQASSVAETARETVADVAANISPVTIEVRSTTPAVKKRASGRTAKKAVKAARPKLVKTKKTKKATKEKKAKKAKKATKRAARRGGKQTKKAGKKFSGKTVGRAKKAKAAKKRSRR